MNNNNNKKKCCSAGFIWYLKTTRDVNFTWNHWQKPELTETTRPGLFHQHWSAADFNILNEFYITFASAGCAPPHVTCPRKLPKDYKRVPCCHRQNSRWPLFVNEPPFHQGNVLSWGQATSSRAQRKVFLSGPEEPAGCTSRSWQDGNTSLLLHIQVWNTSQSLYDRRLSHHSGVGPRPTHVDCTFVDRAVSVVWRVPNGRRSVPNMPLN